MTPTRNGFSSAANEALTVGPDSKRHTAIKRERSGRIDGRDE